MIIKKKWYIYMYKGPPLPSGLNQIIYYCQVL